MEEEARLKNIFKNLPKVLIAGVIACNQRATELFEAAYDEHAHRLAELFKNV